MARHKASKQQPRATKRRRRNVLSATEITAEEEQASDKPVPRRRTMRQRLWRGLRWLVMGGTVALLLHLIIFAFVPPISLLMIERWVTGQPVTRDYVSLDEVSPRLIASVVASEDSQFCHHWGVDFNAVWDVLEQAWDDDEAPTRGASTITMQVTKNLYLWPLPSYMRKVVEAPLALVVDLVWSKQRIMEVYLNIAEWGPNGVIGAEAGAQRAFGKSAKNLSPRQAAILTTSLPNPIKRNAAKPSRRQLLVANVVERRARSSELPLDCFSKEYRP
jgi:monofunctional glycosyltransferase